APGPAYASPAYGALQSLAKDITFTWAREHPTIATQEGIAGYDGALEAPSEANRRADIALILSWQGRLHRIVSPAPALTLVERDDAKLLQAQLTGLLRQYTVYMVDRKDYAGPANALVGAVFTQFEHLPASRGASSAASAKAWADIISRLEKAPAYIAAGQRLVTTPGHLYGVVGSQEL